MTISAPFFGGLTEASVAIHHRSISPSAQSCFPHSYTDVAAEHTHPHIFCMQILVSGFVSLQTQPEAPPKKDWWSSKDEQDSLGVSIEFK